MGLNRISWKPVYAQVPHLSTSLPMGLNRISWKPLILDGYDAHGIGVILPLPMGLNRISWKPKSFLLCIGPLNCSPTDGFKSD